MDLDISAFKILVDPDCKRNRGDRGRRNQFFYFVVKRFTHTGSVSKQFCLRYNIVRCSEIWCLENDPQIRDVAVCKVDRETTVMNRSRLIPFFAYRKIILGIVLKRFGMLSATVRQQLTEV